MTSAEQDGPPRARSMEAGDRPFSGDRKARIRQALRESLGRFDADGDGRLNQREQAARRRFFENLRRTAGGARLPNGDANLPIKSRLLRRFDRDKDGRLNAEERAALRKAQAAFSKRRDSADRRIDRTGPAVVDEPSRSLVDRSGLLGRFDRDGNGQLSGGERLAALRAFQSRGR